MLEFLRRLFRPRMFAAWSVDHDRGGYLVSDLFVPRSAVKFIVAYKRDRVTIDQLCIGIAYGEPDADNQCAALHIEEDNPCYKAILADLEQHFALREGWWREATREPFATDAITIWQRSDAPGGALPE